MVQLRSYFVCDIAIAFELVVYPFCVIASAFLSKRCRSYRSKDCFCKHNTTLRLTIILIIGFRVHKIVKQDNACAICLEPLNNADNSINSSGDSALGLLRCGHIFHFECIWRWLRAHFNCPVCRTQAKLTVDDIKAITIAAFEKAVRSKTLPSRYKKKSRNKKIKGSGSKESMSISLSGAETDSSSPSGSPIRNNFVSDSRSSNSSVSSLNFIILEDGNIGESDESLHIVSPTIRPKFRPNVRNHKFKRKSTPDLPTLSLTSLASIPEGEGTEVDLSANRSATLPSFSRPVVMGKFTSQHDLGGRSNEGDTSKQNVHLVGVDKGADVFQNGDVTIKKNSAKTEENKTNDKGNDFQSIEPELSVESNCDRRNHLANYTPTIQQLQKLPRVSQSSLWSSQQSEFSDGVISMLNLVQEEQQADTMREAIEEEIKKTTSSFNPEENPWVTMCSPARDMVESTEEKIEIPQSIHSNWILKDTP